MSQFLPRTDPRDTNSTKQRTGSSLTLVSVPVKFQKNENASCWAAWWRTAQVLGSRGFAPASIAPWAPRRSLSLCSKAPPTRIVASMMSLGSRSRGVRLLACVIGFSAFLCAGSASALDSSSRGAARQLGYEGVEAYQAENFAVALDKLERAYKVLRVPSLGLWSARALEKSGQWVEASERYLETTRLPNDNAGDPVVQEKAKEEARAERKVLLTKIPKVIVQIEGADPELVRVTIDGVSVNSALFGAGRPTNPGTIEVIAQWGERTVKGTVTVAEGEEKSITLAFKQQPVATAPGATPAQEVAHPKDSSGAPAISPAAEPEDRSGSHWQPVVGWTALGVGAAGLVFGGVTGVLTLMNYSQLRNDCGKGDHSCPPDYDYEQRTKNYNTLRILSGAGLIAGGVLAAAGLTLVLTAPKKRQNAANLSPYLGMTSFGLKGTF